MTIDITGGLMHRTVAALARATVLITNVFPVADVATTLAASSSHPSVVMLVTGHGSIVGLGDGSSLQPAGICDALRGVPGAQICVLLLSQCFAGIFNFVDCTKGTPLVVAGGTNLNQSLSLLLQLRYPVPQADGADGLSAWRANLFAFFFFSWLRSPVDIDGDGQLTLADAYRYAGAAANTKILESKVGLFRQAQMQERALADAEAALKTLQQQLTTADAAAQQALQSLIPMNQLNVQAAASKLQNTLQLLHVHQEPWLLNANVTRAVHFSGFTKTWQPLTAGVSPAPTP